MFSRVISVSNKTVKLSIDEDEQLIVHELSDSDVQEFNLFSQSIAKMLVVILS